MESFLVMQIVPALFAGIFGVQGFILNSTILSMYIRLWRKVTSPGVSDQILFCMALTGLLLQCSLVINCFLLVVQIKRGVDTHLLLFSFYIVFVFYNMSFWNTAWLSISYCVKLVNISHRILQQLKVWFLSSIKKILIGSAVSSVFIMSPFFWATDIIFLQSTNITEETLAFKIEINIYYSVFVLLVGYLLPFTLTAFCIGLSVSALVRHIQRIRQNVSQFGSPPQLRALIRAVVTMTLRVILDQSFLILFGYAFAMSFYLDTATAIIFSLLLLSYPSIQSFVLFIGNPKLKRFFVRPESTFEATMEQ